ncbi:inositol 2-dehydrogenase [Aidingimonas halophila]|uniref:Myo-inositol 2-dehydrogenase n=1 Tax=Aidingimonas halophila TaxID=574349 RepID=A0A1H2ZD24_9GAMM|nr:inositol 2-dehydrogenase [Aidingimonas halophila]GHC15797.1 inositol 2-dehydrogenase [Aidingimonas halophila]SDX15280.1 myo-inositol 2-dehydrogenase [Aidingimonas halophila]
MQNITLIGAGNIGKLHAANIAAHPRSRLVNVVDIDPANGESLAAAYGARSSSLESALGDPDIDAVVITSATSTHADLIERAAHAGKRIFCEKPIDLAYERVLSCLETVKRYEALLFIGFNRRFDPNMAHLKSSLDSGEIGNLELLTICSRDPGALPIEYLKISGGMWRDMTIHDFDLARWILGEEPVTVHGVASALTSDAIRDIGDIDTAVVTLRCASGRLAVITNSRRAVYGYDQRVEAHGSDGMLAVENVPKSTLVKSTQEGVIKQKPKDFYMDRYPESYRIEWDRFLNACEGQEPPAVHGWDGERALALAEAAYESLATGKMINVS